MKSKTQCSGLDETIALLVFLLCCILSFFQHHAPDAMLSLTN